MREKETERNQKDMTAILERPFIVCTSFGALLALV